MAHQPWNLVPSARPLKSAKAIRGHSGSRVGAKRSGLRWLDIALGAGGLTPGSCSRLPIAMPQSGSLKTWFSFPTTGVSRTK